MHIPIVAITGTKGKTTTVAVVADVLRTLGRNVLKVDTTGHFVNGERRSTLDDSKASWGLVPSVAPGRYLWEFHANPELVQNGAAVLECSLGCSASSGMAYRYHKVGVFLNVFEDHLGSSERIKSREDIARAKDFIFRRLDDNSTAVFNADDELVCKTLAVLPESKDYTLVPCGLEFSHFDIAAHLAAGGTAFTVNEQQQIVLRTASSDKIVADLKAIPWTFQGTFMPSVWNILQATAAIYGFFDGTLPEGFREALEAVRLDRYSGRLTLLRAENQATILADYAHEKVSLRQVADLGRTLLGSGGKLIGVVRLAHDRSDTLLRETGEEIGKAFDQLVVYDKIDGHFRKPTIHRGRFPQVVGRTSAIVTEGIASVHAQVERIIREDEAIKRAAELAGPNDVVVVIVNDDIERSIEFIRQSFKAEFV